jgi:SAM-dependent methyltransferase
MEPSSSSSTTRLPGPEFYSSLGLDYESAFSHDASLHKFLQLALQHLPSSGAHILDMGCGTGNPVAVTLAAAGHRITGVDISDTMVELSQKAVPSGSFSVADMREYEHPPSEEIDALFNIFSLFLLSREDFEEMARRWARWLRPGGLLCIGTLAAEDCDPVGKGQGYDKDGRCARDIGFRFMGADCKITLFTRDGWRWLLEGNGFEILDTMTELFVPPKEADSDQEEHYYIIARKR